MSSSSQKIIFFLIVGLTAGFFLRGYVKSAPPPTPTCEENICEEKLKALKSKFEKISEEDINEYIQLKEMKAKYEKADEIFGKILNIFLLDLGLRVSAQQMADLKSAPKVPPPTAEPATPQLPLQKAEVRTQDVAASPKPMPRRILLKTRNIESDDQIKKIVNEAVLENALSSWGSAVPLQRSDFNFVRGRFAGQIIFLNKEKKPWDVELELTNARFDRGRIIGEFILKTIDPANPKHRDTTTYDAGSTIPNFRSAEDGAILVEAMGGDGLFQLYYFNRLNAFQGNVYEKEGLNPFKRTGTISLYRR
jgi:hypothetical protein